MSEQALRDEIKRLEEEVRELEEGGGIDLIELVKQQFENVDDLLVDIINAESVGTKTSQVDELAEMHEIESIPKIKMENIYRFNSVTLFPVSNDENLSYLGIRFDVFEQTTRKFKQSHYIILERKDVVTMKGVLDSGDWKWTVKQTTIPKNIDLNIYEQQYLFEGYPEIETLDETNLIGLNMINKFSMRVYEELCK